MLGSITVDCDAFHSVGYDTAAKIRLVQYSNSFVLPQTDFAESERKASIDINAADFDIDSKRTGLQSCGHSCEITVRTRGL